MPPELDDPWQEFARNLLLDAVALRGLQTTRQLADLLAGKGVVIAPKTLSRRINRGAFDAGFFLMCLDVLAIDRIEFAGKQSADVVLRPQKTAGRRPRKA